MVDNFNQSEGSFWVTLNEMDHIGNGVRNCIAFSFRILVPMERCVRKMRKYSDIYHYKCFNMLLFCILPYQTD